jgi:hypothetical protein
MVKARRARDEIAAIFFMMVDPSRIAVIINAAFVPAIVTIQKVQKSEQVIL